MQSQHDICAHNFNYFSKCLSEIIYCYINLLNNKLGTRWLCAIPVIVVAVVVYFFSETSIHHRILCVSVCVGVLLFCFGKIDNIHHFPCTLVYTNAQIKYHKYSLVFTHEVHELVHTYTVHRTWYVYIFIDLLATARWLLPLKLQAKWRPHINLSLSLENCSWLENQLFEWKISVCIHVFLHFVRIALVGRSPLLYSSIPFCCVLCVCLRYCTSSRLRVYNFAKLPKGSLQNERRRKKAEHITWP